jgi:hypothetical protein
MTLVIINRRHVITMPIALVVRSSLMFLLPGSLRARTTFFSAITTRVSHLVDELIVKLHCVTTGSGRGRRIACHFFSVEASRSFARSSAKIPGIA